VKEPVKRENFSVVGRRLHARHGKAHTA